VAVNYRDILVRRGVHPVAALPSGIGLESAGTIAAIGDGVGDLSVGQRVACVAGPDGAYAEYRLVRAARVVPQPPSIDARTAGARMISRMTASTCRTDLSVGRRHDPGTRPRAASSHHAPMAKQLGATVIGTVSSAAKAAIARAHGCDHPLVLNQGDQEDFVARVRALTDHKGVPVVYDSIGRATFEGSLQCLARRGVLASFGEASGDPAPIAPRRLGALGSVYVTHPSLGDYTATRAELLATANHLFDMVASGRIRIEISAEYPLHDAARAHADMEARRTTGSIVLIV
jgi:NADPH2:quinone reductase